MRNQESTWFGEKIVSPEEKTENVIHVFDSVAQRYDVMNDLMSVGIHRLWKNQLVRMIRPRASLNGEPLHYLDVAGGTGDIAFRIYDKIVKQNKDIKPKITLCDLNTNMLAVGRARAQDRGWVNDFHWVTGNAESLPIPDNNVDVYTIAFGLRNVTHIDDALKDAYRVLKPGGRFFCLEFSHVQPALLAKAYDAYSYAFIPKIGEVVTKDRESYQYLVESIRKFPTQKKLALRMQEAGFKHVKYTNLSAGIAAIHQGFKA